MRDVLLDFRLAFSGQKRNDPGIEIVIVIKGDWFGVCVCVCVCLSDCLSDCLRKQYPIKNYLLGKCFYGNIVDGGACAVCVCVCVWGAE